MLYVFNHVQPTFSLRKTPFFLLHNNALTHLLITAVAKILSLEGSHLCCSYWHNRLDEGLSNRRTCLQPAPPSTLGVPLSLSFSTVCNCLFHSSSLFPLPPWTTHTASVFSSQVISAALFQRMHRCLFQRSSQDGITINSNACKSISAMMKKFVTIVLRGLVSLSKENPIWAKEHHRPPNKEIRRKHRTAKRAKTMGRCNLVRAVGISPVVSHPDHCFLRCQSLDVYSHDLVVLFIWKYIWEYSALAFCEQFKLDPNFCLNACPDSLKVCVDMLWRIFSTFVCDELCWCWWEDYDGHLIEHYCKV